LVPELLRDEGFRRYWNASVVSQLGGAVSVLAIPLTATVTLHANAAEMGYLGALMWTPSLLFSLPIGALADRIPHRRHMMITANLASFVVLASVPTCYGLGLLSLRQLYAVVFLAGVCIVVFNVCDGTLFVSLVESRHYVEAQSLIYGSQATASLFGPSIGGLLVQVLSAPLAIVVDAASFLGSAFLLNRVRAIEPPLSRDRSDRALSAGVWFILHTEEIRSVLALAAGVNLFCLIFDALFVLFLSQDLHIHSTLIGVLLAVEAVGGITGALVTKKIVRLLRGEGRALMVGSVMISAPLMVVPLTREVSPGSLTLLCVGVFGSGFGRVVLNVTIGSIFAIVVPDPLRSRTKGAFQTISFGARPIGSLLGGLLGTELGHRSALWIGAGGGAMMFVWLLPSKLLKSEVIQQTPRPLAGRAERDIRTDRDND
jgi:MFS family permease